MASKDELYDELNGVAGDLDNAISGLAKITRLARQVEGIDPAFAGQIEADILPRLRDWASSERQPGSIPSLRAILDGKE